MEEMYDKRIWINRTIELLEKNQYKISWGQLSSNPNAISILEKNQDKINWDRLSCRNLGSSHAPPLLWARFARH